MRSIIKNILIPVDFSSTSLNALNTAIKMAKRHGANLHLLYVQNVKCYYPKMGQTDKFQPFTEDVSEKNRYLIKKMAMAILNDFQVNCILYFEIGNTEKVLLNKARDLKTDLIVIGTTPALNNETYVFDTFPYRVIKKVSCNVLTVPSLKVFNEFSNVIFPVFAKSNPMLRLYTARTIIKKNNSRVSVLGIARKQDENLCNTVKTVSDRIKSEKGMFTGFATTRLLYTTNVIKEVSNICRKKDAELIIINADTDRTLKEFFFGNFTQKMIRDPETAVLCVKA